MVAQHLLHISTPSQEHIQLSLDNDGLEYKKGGVGDLICFLYLYISYKPELYRQVNKNKTLSWAINIFQLHLWLHGRGGCIATTIPIQVPVLLTKLYLTKIQREHFMKSYYNI